MSRHYSDYLIRMPLNPDKSSHMVGKKRERCKGEFKAKLVYTEHTAQGEQAMHTAEMQAQESSRAGEKGDFVWPES